MTGHNSWWHMIHAQHAAHNAKYEKMGLCRLPQWWPYIVMAHKHIFIFIQYLSPNWPWYSLHGLHILITWFSLYGIHMALLPYMVRKDRYCDVTMIWPLLFHGIRADVSESPNNPLTMRMHGDYRLDGFFVGFNVICCAFLRNNTIYIEGRNCSFSTVPVLFNKCSGLRSSDTLSSWWLGWRRHARVGKPFFGK